MPHGRDEAAPGVIGLARAEAEAAAAGEGRAPPQSPLRCCRPLQPVPQPSLRWGTAAWAMQMYHVTPSGSAYEPKKACAKTVGEVFRLSASTERGEAAGAFAGSNLGGCFPCPGQGLLARVWVRGWWSGRGWASLQEQINLLWPVLRLAKEMEGRLHPSVVSPGVATGGMGGGAGRSLRRGNQGIHRALLSVGRQQRAPRVWEGMGTKHPPVSLRVLPAEGTGWTSLEETFCHFHLRKSDECSECLGAIVTHLEKP